MELAVNSTSGDRQQPRYAEVIDFVERLIERGELSAGALLPSERQLAKQLGISRNVVRCQCQSPF